MKACSYVGCCRPKKSKGLCNSHYEQQRLGKPLTDLRPYGRESSCLHCDNDAQVKGMCRTCYQKTRAHAHRRKAVELLGDECADCGVSYPIEVYDFHHRDPSEKEMLLAASWWKSWDSLLPEIEKCDLLCANCHRVRHAESELDWENDSPIEVLTA